MQSIHHNNIYLISRQHTSSIAEAWVWTNSSSTLWGSKDHSVIQPGLNHNQLFGNNADNWQYQQ